MRALKWAGLGLAALSAVCVVRAATVSPPTFAPGPAPALPRFDEAAVAQALSHAVAVPTVSRRTGGEAAAFEQLHATLLADVPRVQQTLSRERIGEHALLLRWAGRDASAPPILLTAHLDVVPVEPDTLGEWTHPPFSGAIADGFVWGRGAIDDKTAVVTILAAIEALLQAGHVPACDVWLALGDDEEVGGRGGAMAIAATLRDRGVRPRFVLDEGGAVVDGVLPGVTRPVALVGIAEKGAASLELTVVAEGGHSSMPPRGGAIARLAAAVVRLDESPMPASLRGPAAAMIDRLTPELGFAARLALANRWLLGPAVTRVLSSHPASNAIVRTTTAPTIFAAGSADNVLAAHARAVVNFRILPGETVQDVIDHAVHVIDDDAVTVRCLDHCWDPSPVSPDAGEGWDDIAAAIAWTWPDALVSPSLVVGATDARHYAGISDRVYRFLPIRLDDVDRKRLHGTDERIAVADVGRAVAFYAALLTATTR